MGATKRQDSIVCGLGRTIRVHADRHPVWETFFLRIYHSIRSNDGNRNHSGIREEGIKMQQVTLEMPDDAKGVIFYTSEFKKWVYDHAPEVVFLMFLFGVTWIIGIVNIFVSLAK